MKSILFIFLDGVGLGNPNENNPLYNLQLSGFNWLSGGQKWVNSAPARQSSSIHVFNSIDANLGVEGLPQSGTGQATLFTGVNCSKLAGKHYGPYPHSTSKPVIASSNVFLQTKALISDGGPAFLNAYPDRFFQAAKKRNRWSVTTRCCLDAGLHIRTIDNLRSGTAVAADIHGKGLHRITRPEVPVIDEGEAAKRMASLAQKHNFLLFEYFMTDKVGHDQDAAAAKTVLESVDRLLLGLSEQLNSEQTTLILTSDHGNIEDLSIRTHTFNPVPFAAIGSLAEHFVDVQDLTDVTPAIVAALSS